MSADPAGLLGDLSPLETRCWQGLQAGRIEFQRCGACARPWLPPSHECPSCLSSEWRWEAGSGAGELVSWVVYHHAFHPALRKRVPYAVALVELAEGPRMVAALDRPGDAECGARVELDVIERDGARLARARLTQIADPGR